MAAQAATELLRRRQARSELGSWCRLAGFDPSAEHHQLLLQKLEAVERGEIKRLIIEMPPGSAKSTYASDLFPAWYLSRNPARSLIAASHTAELAEHFGRRVRNRINQHQAALGFSMAADSKAAGRWTTNSGGDYFAAGIGGAIAGRRADLAVIDDPVKSREDVDSKIYRDRQWEWFKFDLMTRLKPDAAIVLILTRWHVDDLAGRILDNEADEWEVLRIPMEAEADDPLGREPGTRLWAEYFTEEMVTAAKRDPRVWAALYQQNPLVEGGNFFRKEWLIGYEASQLPVNLNVYAASDHAVSEAESADYTCLIAGGLAPNGLLYILPDLFWEQSGPERTVDGMMKLVRDRNPLIWWGEKGHISKSLGPFLKMAMRVNNLYCNVQEVTPTRDKRTRAQAINARMSMGMVRFPTFAPWWPKAEAELLAFPAGKHDDFVDALAHLGMGLDRMAPAHQINVGQAIANRMGTLTENRQTLRGAYAG